LVIFGVLVVLLVVIVGGVYLFRDRITGDVNDLQVGDCIDSRRSRRLSPTSSISRVPNHTTARCSRS